MAVSLCLWASDVVFFIFDWISSPNPYSLMLLFLSRCKRISFTSRTSEFLCLAREHEYLVTLWTKFSASNWRICCTWGSRSACVCEICLSNSEILLGGRSWSGVWVKCSDWVEEEEEARESDNDWDVFEEDGTCEGKAKCEEPERERWVKLDEWIDGCGIWEDGGWSVWEEVLAVFDEWAKLKGEDLEEWVRWCPEWERLLVGCEDRLLGRWTECVEWWLRWFWA